MRALKTIIVSRHPAAVAWLRAAHPEFAGAPVVDSISAIDVVGADIVGNIPLQMAVIANSVYAIEFDRPPRGAEYSVDDMVRAGARLVRYRVRHVE